MTEIISGISYSPEGVLEVRSSLDESQVVDSQLSRIVQSIGHEHGYETAVLADELFLRVAIPVLLSDGPSGEMDGRDADKLIRAVQIFGGLGGSGSKGGILSLEYAVPRGLVVFVHPYFQRWLNGPGLSEQPARACIDAMASVFGVAIHTNTMRNMRYDPHRRLGSGSCGDDDFTSFGVTSDLADFKISEAILSPEGVTSRYGQAAWQSLRLSTLGNCACMGVEGDDREVYTGGEIVHPGLYRWKSHNVDSAVQSVSLLLGAASLAYTASLYQGEEDIFAHNVQWT